MPNTKCSSYKGCSIITRWTELDALSDKPVRRFSASFSVDPSDTDEDPWQQFSLAVFNTPARATAAALAAAKSSIDLNREDAQHE